MVRDGHNVFFNMVRNGWIIVKNYSHFVPAISYHSENHFRTITISYHCHFVPYADRYIITISYHMQIDTL
jgi:hypothetical protein